MADRTAEAIARLERAQQATDARLARIEAALGITAPPEPPPAAPEPPAMSAPAPPRRAPLLETRMGLTWINRIGVITLVLGVAFFFKYAVDNRWIGETGRVALGIVAGLALLAAGERLWRHNQGAFAQGITAAGISILFVSIYACFGFYRLLPQGVAFALMSLNTLAAAALALRYSAQAIAALALAGGFLTPVVLGSGADVPWFFLGYLLVLSLGAATLAGMRDWRLLDALAFAGASTLFLAWIANQFQPGRRLVATVFALAFYAVFLTRRLRPVAALAPGAALVELVAISVPGISPFLWLAAPVIAAALRFPTFAAFWLCYAAGHFDFKYHAPRELVAGLLMLPFALFLLGPWARWSLIAVPLNAAFYFMAAYGLLEQAWRDWMGLMCVGLAAAHFAAGRWRRPAYVYYGVAVALVTLAAPIQFSGFKIAMAWAAEGAALAWIGARIGERRLGWAAGAVFGCMFLALAADTSSFLTFCVAAASLWVAARAALPWIGAAFFYVGGHLVMLWGLVVEVLDWAARTASQADVANFQSTAVSILLAAYSVLLVGIGVATRTALNRILGLAIMGAVVAKLYFYDVWRIDRGMYRVAAFAGLGIFLLLMSYLYLRRENRGQ